MPRKTTSPSPSPSPSPSLASAIMISMVAGVLAGVLLRWLSTKEHLLAYYLTDGLFFILGQLFITALKMLVVPLLLSSIVCATFALSKTSKLGILGGKTLLLYVFTTPVAITLAIICALFFAPGEGAHLITARATEAIPSTTFTESLIQLFPNNPVEAMARGDTLQIIVFSILLGLSIVTAEEKGEGLRHLFESSNDVMMQMVSLIMTVAPYGVFCLIVHLAATIELTAMASLLKYCLLLIGVLILQVVFTYFSMLMILARLNPLVLIRKVRGVLMFAFSTASSNATIPLTIKTVTRDLGVSSRIASFTIPLGSTINMDGTAIMQGIATVFTAQAFGIELGLQQYLTVIFTATLASVGTAAVPGVGLVTLTMVLQQVGLPLEGIALIMGVDRVLDMLRTAVNVMGDCTFTCIIANSEGELNREVFDGR